MTTAMEVVEGETLALRRARVIGTIVGWFWIITFAAALAWAGISGEGKRLLTPRYTVYAAGPMDVHRAAGDRTDQCLRLRPVDGGSMMLSDPPQGITVVVRGRSAAEAVAKCLRGLTYLPVTITRDN